MKEFYLILLPLALILFASKSLGLISKKLGLPQVVGMLIAGLLLGLIQYIPGQQIFTPFVNEGLSFIAKIGVVLIMFSAGIETDTKQFKKTGLASIVITILGVVLPLALGFIVAAAFNGGFVNMSREQALTNVFYGTILTATSVSITVATLKELGKLNSRAGSAIVSAAILDDIIGVILLSLIIGLKGRGTAIDVALVIGKTIGFFAVAFIGGIVIKKGFKLFEKKFNWKRSRRFPIYSFAICFFFAWLAERIFGVADITGAYLAGLILSGVRDAEYIDSKVETSNYMVFAPVFFANIGIQSKLGAISPSMIGFGFAFIAVAIIGKVVGCGLGAKMFKYTNKESLRVGIGMMARAEVVLVCAQKGIDNNMIDEGIMPFILLLIIITSIFTPLLLKLTYKGDLNDNVMLAPSVGQISENSKPNDNISYDNATIPNCEQTIGSEQNSISQTIQSQNNKIV